jgi:dihydrofolate synthase/folylpolyglutamate synthase
VTYPETIEFLYSLRMAGLKLGLENTRRLAGLAGNPHQRLQFIHIAGTNGKGSVAAMLESIYRTAGHRVGLFTSPHLVSFRERIQVNRQLIPEADVVRLAERLRKLGAGGKDSRDNTESPGTCVTTPTFFEFVTVLALRWFEEQQCDLVIWETGLGGRLDSTNIVTPLASVITNVAADHQLWLGNDLGSIAREKAGIIKESVPVVTATDNPQAAAVIREVAREQRSPVTWVTKERAREDWSRGFKPVGPGQHQRINAATALATVEVLQHRLPVSPEALQRGLATVHWPGRLQLFESHDGRLVLLDGAHNPAAAESLRTTLEEEFANRRIVLILGILKDKDWMLICASLAVVANSIFCVPVKSDRSADPNALAEACRSTQPSAEVEVADSVESALEKIPAGTLGVVAGSLYLVGEALQALQKSEDKAPANESGLNDWSAAPGV